MDLMGLLVLVIVFSLIIWVVQALLPIPAPFKNVILVIISLILILYLLSAVGLFHGGTGLRLRN